MPGMLPSLYLARGLSTGLWLRRWVVLIRGPNEAATPHPSPVVFFKWGEKGCRSTANLHLCPLLSLALSHRGLSALRRTMPARAAGDKDMQPPNAPEAREVWGKVQIPGATPPHRHLPAPDRPMTPATGGLWPRLSRRRAKDCLTRRQASEPQPVHRRDSANFG